MKGTLLEKKRVAARIQRPVEGSSGVFSKLSLPVASIVTSRFEALRRDLGLTQSVLAEAAGITRQAVGAIESGRMQPSVGIALRLARALGETVERLFGCEEPPAAATRVVVATIGGRTVEHALDTDQLATEPAESAASPVFVAGCDLSVGLLARHAAMRSRDVRVLWLAMTNRAALSALASGRVHAAVVHGDLTPEQSRLTADHALFELATTEAGWIVAHGNPMGLNGAVDLMRKKARLANRPAGAGARRLLDAQLRRADIDPRLIAGYGHEFAGHLDAARAIAQGFADSAVATASVARIFKLHFMPLRTERCVFIVSPATLRTPEIRALLDALRSPPYRRDLEAFQAYDVTRTGERYV